MSEASSEPRRRLGHSAKRVLELLRLNAPDNLLLNEIGLLVMYGLWLNPEECGARIGHLLAAPVRNYHDRCERCNGPLKGAEQTCVACKLEEEREFGQYLATPPDCGPMTTEEILRREG